MGGDRPIVMVNLLKFRDKAQYDEPGEPEMTGREAYDRYGSVMAPLVLAMVLPGGVILRRVRWEGHFPRFILPLRAMTP